jgi:ankyrin repeat protein
MTPLHFASYFGHAEVFEFLANKGVNLGAKTDTRFTAIHLACLTGHLEVVKQYDKYTKKEDRATMDEFGKYPIHYAAEEGFHQVIHLILSLNNLK